MIYTAKLVFFLSTPTKTTTFFCKKYYF